MPFVFPFLFPIPGLLACTLPYSHGRCGPPPVFQYRDSSQLGTVHAIPGADVACSRPQERQAYVSAAVHHFLVAVVPGSRTVGAVVTGAAVSWFAGQLAGCMPAGWMGFGENVVLAGYLISQAVSTGQAITVDHNNWPAVS